MISIVIPVYNVEKYLAECLDSVFSQTFKNIEVLIVNDGSTDNSKNIINKYRNKHSNLLYFEQENKGLSVARNLATKYATGDYIIYLDSDDYIEKNMIELMYNKAKQLNADVVICAHNEIYEDIPGKIRNVNISTNINMAYSGIQVANMMLDLKISGVTWNKLFRRELVEITNLYFEPGRYTQDWYPIFKYITNCKAVGFVTENLYNYRIRSGATSSQINKKRLDDYTHAVSNIIDCTKNNNLKYNKNSLKKFKVVTFGITIKMYKDLKKGAGYRLYSNFYSNNYKIPNLSFSDIFTAKKVGIRYKINLILWKIKLFHVYNL